MTYIADNPAPSTEAFTSLPAWTYRSHALAQLEYERLILPSWQFACHVNQVKEPGTFVTLDLMRDSVIVMRDREGALRAFKNVCRHRGARLLDGSGTCNGPIVCPYHGWSYDHDGSLRALPAKKTFPSLERARYGLETVELEVFHGLVFVRVVAGGPSLKELWGDYSELIAPYRIESLRPLGPVMTTVWNCNWKTAVDNNLENYHVPVGHPGYHRMLDNDMAGFMNAHGIAGSKSVLRDEPSSNRTERLYQRLAPQVLTDLPEATRRTWFFFTMPPNIGIDIYPDSIDVFQILPRTGTTCTVRYPVFGPKDDRREARIVRYLNSRINRQVMAEDRALCERVQQGLASHGYEPGPLSSLEIALKDFHDRIRAVIPEVDLPEEPADLGHPSAAALRIAAE
jgi:phenylpropionate dioxygenase-like ring-hydroxylating dioxygenase large terminal subunit